MISFVLCVCVCVFFFFFFFLLSFFFSDCSRRNFWTCPSARSFTSRSHRQPNFGSRKRQHLWPCCCLLWRDRQSHPPCKKDVCWNCLGQRLQRSRSPLAIRRNKADRRIFGIFSFFLHFHCLILLQDLGIQAVRNYTHTHVIVAKL